MREEKAIALAVIGITILATLATLPVRTHATPTTTYEYIIVTKAPLADDFQVLADWKAHWLNGSKVVTVNDDASAADIKNVIEDYWANHSTRFVLLGGDVGVIPCHKTRVDTGLGYSLTIAQDFWFANFDEDQENVSEYEVYIGRAPVDNAEETAHFVNKVIAYEQMEKPKANLFHSTEDIYFDPPPGVRLANKCMQHVPSDYANYTLFEELDDRVTKDEWKNFWRNEGIMCVHYGHGWDATKYEINAYSGKVFWEVADVPSLDNTFWPVHTSAACYTGWFDVEDCLAEAYVKADHGAIAVFMNYKEGLGGYVDEFIEMQFYTLYQEGYQNIGAILAESKHHFIDEATDPDPNHEVDRKRWEYTYRNINLFGDSETPVLTKRVLDFNLSLTVLAKDQYDTNLTTGDVYIDGQWCGCTGSAFMVSTGSQVFVSDFWESNKTGYRYFFDHWEDGPKGNPRTITVVQDTTITAHFKKKWCPGDVNGDGTVDSTDKNLIQEAYFTQRGDPNWDSRCDLNCDGMVTGGDMIIYGKYIGNTYLDLTVLAEDQYHNSLTAGDVYIDDEYVGNTGSTFTVIAGTHKVRVSDSWASDGFTYHFTNWEDNSTDNPRNVTVMEDKTIKAYFHRTGWVSPTGHEDPGSFYSNEPNAYDDDESSYCYSSTVRFYKWSSFLILTLSEAITSDKLRLKIGGVPHTYVEIDVDVYKDGAWVDVYQGWEWNWSAWQEKTYAEGSVEKMRLRFRNMNYLSNPFMYIYEADF